MVWFRLDSISQVYLNIWLMKCNICNGYVLNKIKKYAAKILDQGNPYISLSKM